MRILSIFLCLLFLAGCAEATPPIETAPEVMAETALEETTLPTEAEVTTSVPPDPVEVILEQMSIEERVGQLFLARCNEDTALEDIYGLRLGGFLLFGADFEGETPDSLREKLTDYQSAAKIPMLIAVDEEGGTVTRVSSQKGFRKNRFPSPREAFSAGGMPEALKNENDKCTLLASLGINVNLGPVCDISTEPGAFMYQRSLGENSAVTGDFAVGTVEIMEDYRIGSVLKHFPGYGNNPDTHTGIAVDERSLEELESWDLVPFAAGMDAGADGILVSHTIVTALDEEVPASLSPAVHGYLRDVMGFEGVIITDDLVMQAITDSYGAGEAAVLAVLVGNDLLCSTEYWVQYEAVLTAVMEGRISFDMLNNAVRRILSWKIELGLL